VNVISIVYINRDCSVHNLIVRCRQKNKTYDFGWLNSFKDWFVGVRRWDAVAGVIPGESGVWCISYSYCNTVSGGTERLLMRAEKLLMRHMNNMNANRNKGHVHIPVSPSYSYSRGANRNEGYIRIPLFLSEPYSESLLWKLQNLKSKWASKLVLDWNLEWK
jgi:hypothetical protein